MNCPNCDFKNLDRVVDCAWCKKPLPRGVAAVSAPAKQPAPLTTPKPEQAGPVPAAPVWSPVQGKYQALIGLVMAAAANVIYLRVKTDAVIKSFGGENLWAVYALTGLIAAALGYYASYKIAASPGVKNALGRGALAGLFIGLSSGFAAEPAAGMAFTALAGLPAGAACGFLNLLILRYAAEARRRNAGPASEVSEPPLTGVKAYSALGALIGIVANLIFLGPWSRQMHSQFTTVAQVTSLLAGGIGFYYGKKVALARRASEAMGHGAAAGAWIGVVNGSAVFPVIGTIVGGVLGALIGAFIGGPLAFFLIKASRWTLRDYQGGKSAGKRNDSD